MPSTTSYSKPYFVPTQVSGCQLWLDAADTNTVQISGGAVTQWNDKSVNGYTATPSGTITYSYPTLSTTSSSYFSVPVDSRRTIAPNLQVFIVYTWLGYGSNTNQGLWGDDTGGWNRLQLLSFPANTEDEYALSWGNTSTPNGAVATGLNTPDKLIYQASYNSYTTNGSAIYLNGTNAVSFTDSPPLTETTDTNTYFAAIGPGSDLPTAIAFNEILMYTTTLSELDRQNIEGYLAQKWSLTSGLPPGHPGFQYTYYKTNSAFAYSVPSLTRINTAFGYASVPK